MTEIWKSISGTHGHYEVSDLGRVRSIDRMISHARHGKYVFYQGKVLATERKRAKAYQIAVLRVDGKSITKTVHRLVAETFISNPKGYPMVLHRDDDPDNNIVRNLRWGTASDNMRDRTCPHCGGLIYG